MLLLWLIVLLLLVVLSLPLLILVLLVVPSRILVLLLILLACVLPATSCFPDRDIGSLGRFGHLCAFWCFFWVCLIADVLDPSMVAVMVLSVLEVVLKAILELDDLHRVGGSWISDGLGRLVLGRCLMTEHVLAVMDFFLIGHGCVNLFLKVRWCLCFLHAFRLGPGVFRNRPCFSVPGFLSAVVRLVERESSCSSYI